MYCPNCGAQVNDGVKFCGNCGTQMDQVTSAVNENPVPAQEPEAVLVQPVVTKKKKQGFSTILIGIAVVIIAIIGISSMTGERSVPVNQYIEFVKNGYPEAYPNITYGQAFDSFFTDPVWKYFKSDEDRDIVEFSGGCLYQEAEVTATIQFILSYDEGSFETGYFDMNGVPQNQLMTYSMIETVFDDYGTNSDDHLPQVIDEPVSIQETADGEQYADLEAFINCICSFSDPPDIEGEELKNYFKEQYDIWKNGEGFYEVSQDENGEFHYQPFAGIDYFEAYSPIVDDVWVNYNEYCEYTLYDLDGDGIKELITSQGTCNADWTNDVYTVENGLVSMLGQFYSPVLFYVAEDGDGLYAVSGHMGVQNIDQITKNGNQLQVSTIMNGEIGEDDYYSNNNPVEVTTVTDYSLLLQ